jgi:penicillin-binding protein-related factor A (putative recombinase)
MPKLEKTIQNAIEEYLTLKRHCFWRNNSGALPTKSGGFVRFGSVGTPDICLVYKGQFFGLEVKQPKGKQSIGQKDFQKRLTDAGGIYRIVTSIDDVIAIGL